MDVKTVLLLGIGMAVLLLLGFCVAPSRSAGLARRPAIAGGTEVMPGRHRSGIRQGPAIAQSAVQNKQPPIFPDETSGHACRFGRVGSRPRSCGLFYGRKLLS